LARIEFAAVVSQEAAHGTGGGQTQVGIDVDLAHAVLDAFDDFLDRHAVGFLDVAAVFVDHRQPLLGYRGGAVHHQVGVGDALVDRLDAVDGQDVAGRRTAELVGAVAGADGDRQGVNLGLLDEVGGLFRIGQHLLQVQCTFGTDAVFLTGLAGLQAAQATQFAFDRDTAGMRHLHRATGHVDVVLVAGWRLAVFAERAVHHDRGKAQLNGALAYRRAGAVVLVHAYRD